MKLNEVLDPGVMMKRLDVLNKDKPKSTHNLIKILRVKANKRNRKTPDTNQNSIYTNHDAMVGSGSTSFKSFVQGIWK